MSASSWTALDPGVCARRCGSSGALCCCRSSPTACLLFSLCDVRPSCAAGDSNISRNSLTRLCGGDPAASVESANPRSEDARESPPPAAFVMLGCCRLRRFGEGGPGLLAEDARGGAGVSPPGSSSVPIPPAPGDTSASGARRVTRTGAACSCGTSAAGLSAAGEPGVSLPPASCAAASAVALPPPCSPSRFDARLDKYHAAAASAPTTSAPLHQHRSAAAGDTKRAQATVSSSKASSRRVGTEPRPVPPVRGHARPLPLGRGLWCTDPRARLAGRAPARVHFVLRAHKSKNAEDQRTRLTQGRGRGFDSCG